jgi:hypothetical protein
MNADWKNRHSYPRQEAFLIFLTHLLFGSGEFSPLGEGERFGDLLVLGGALAFFRDEPPVAGRNETGEDVVANDVSRRHAELTGLSDDAVHFVVSGRHVEDVRNAILHGDVDILRDVGALFVNDYWFLLNKRFGDFGSLALAFHFFPAIDVDGELLFFAFKLLLPALFVTGHFLDGLQILETVRVGACRFGFIAVEEMHFVEVGLDPIRGVGLGACRNETFFERRINNLRTMPSL